MSTAKPRSFALLSLSTLTALLVAAPADAQTPEPAAPAAPASPVSAAAPASTAAQPAGAAAGPLMAGGPVVGAHLGAGFGQVFGDLGTSFVGQLELGWVLDLPDPVDRGIQIFVDGQYAGPESNGRAAKPDERLPDGDGVHYSVVERQAIVDLGVRYRFPLEGELRPFVSLGGRLFLLRSELKASAGGVKFPDREETGTHVGMVADGGLDWLIGSNAVSFALQMGYGGDTGARIRNAGLGSLSMLLGYRRFF